ncbi:unnamed protein product, partial [Mycena citricolor]
WEVLHINMEVQYRQLAILDFPEPDLLATLVTAYFTHFNPCLPVLHRKIFEATLATGRHLVDPQFGSTVLGVCALGSKYCDDPRVILEGTDSTLSAGFRYYRQLKPVVTFHTRLITLYEAQTLCLYMLYLQGSSQQRGCWALAGMGMRSLVAVGAHRRNRFSDKREEEQWKFVFCVSRVVYIGLLAQDLMCTGIMLAVDRISSWSTDRPVAISSEDCDVEYPLYSSEQDFDEISPTENSNPPFMSYFVAYLKLIDIIGLAKSKINSTPKKDTMRLQAVVADI